MIDCVDVICIENNVAATSALESVQLLFLNAAFRLQLTLFVF